MSNIVFWWRDSTGPAHENWVLIQSYPACKSHISLHSNQPRNHAQARKPGLQHHMRMGENGRKKVSKGAKIRNRYNQVPQLAEDTNGKVTNLQLDSTRESQEGSPFPAGDHKEHINRRAQRFWRRPGTMCFNII